MNPEPQNDTSEQIRSVSIGNITVRLARVREEMLMAIDLRRRIAERSKKNEAMVDAVQEVTEDLLVNLVLDSSDIGRIITELAGGRVGTEELLEILTGITTGEDRNREERRRDARQKSGRSPRRRSAGSQR